MTDAAYSTHPEPQAKGRKRRGGLWVNDTELVERLNIDPKIARETFRELDANPRSGFPKKQKLWGNKRYWPAVQDYFNTVYGLKMGASKLGRLE